MPKVVKVHKMKIVRGKKYHCSESGCGGHHSTLATLVCSCGYTKEFKDPDNHNNVRLAMYEHTSEVIKSVGFIFELSE